MENLQIEQQQKVQALDQKPNQTLDGATDQQQPALECPRCNSTNTKFCYYNNYNLSQPRHFCKNCRRYWTKGGMLRNIPVGGATRKNSKRASSASSKGQRPTKTIQVSPAPQSVSSVEPGHSPLLLDCGVGSFSSLLASNGHFGNFGNGSFLGALGPGEVTSSVDTGGNDALWSSGWADLSIYTPGPTFQ